MAGRLKLRCDLEVWPLAEPFGIASMVETEIEAVVVSLEQDGLTGRGEGNGVYFRGETGAGMVAEILGARAEIENGIDRHALQALMPPGGARNAIDCALWDLEAKRTGLRAADLAGLARFPPKWVRFGDEEARQQREVGAFSGSSEPEKALAVGQLRTVVTVGLNAPEAMACKARTLGFAETLKVKLGADDPIACVAAVRRARPDARLIVDANQAWTLDQFNQIWPPLQAMGVEMIEQPLSVGGDGDLSQADCGVTLCADESCHTRSDLPHLRGRYGMINIKLDKTGGLSEALALAHEARAQGFEVMVGNMIGTSLAMAPASLLAPLCRYVDLDGPLLLAADRRPAIVYDEDRLHPPTRELWG